MSFYGKYLGQSGGGGGGGGGGGVTSLNGLTGALTLTSTTLTITPSGGTIEIDVTNAFTPGNLTDVGTDGITITGGTGAVNGSGTTISQHVADTTHNGYLLSTDWNTFNGKQAAGNYITALTGDITASGPGSATSTLATVNSNVGSFTYASITVNGKGLITAASSGTAPTGTVTSVGMSVPSFLSVSGSPITTSGTLAVTLSGTALPVANGGTGVTSVTVVPTGTAFAGWDTNSNLSANSFIPGYTTTPTAASVTTLTVASTYQQFFTGTQSQTVTMPTTSTLVLGQQYKITNLSSSSIVVQASGGGTIQTLVTNSCCILTCINIASSSPSAWNAATSPLTAGSGSVTSVAMTVPTFLSVSGSPITSSGTLGVTLSGTALPIANGGTNNTGAYTAGSIIFSNGTSLTQDNAKLFWDDTDGSLGIGTAVPQAASSMTIINSSGAAKPIWMFAYGTGSNNGIRGDMARGTIGSPTATQTGDVLNFMSGRGYGTSQFATASTGLLQIVAAENFTNTSNATYIAFKTTPTTSVTSAEAMRINSTGNLLIGTTTDSGTQKLQVNGNSNVGTVTAGTWNGSTIGPTFGGTGLAAYTTGDMLYASATNTLSAIAIGSTGNVLTVSGGVPTWAPPATSGTVTSVGMSVPAFLSVSGSPVTSSGTLAVSLSGTALPIANGGTGVTSVTIAPTASAWSGWDANKNYSANNFIPGYATTVTAAGTTALVVGSAQQQFFTGTTTQTVTLPVTSGLALGFPFIITNNSTGTVTVQSSGANTILAQLGGTTVVYTCILTSGTTAASWNYTLIGTGGAITPTVQKFTSSSGTYTTPSPAPLYIEVEMVGGGGGGSGSGTATATNINGNSASASTASTFGTSLLSAGGGGGGVWSSPTGGTGGSHSLGSGPVGTELTGGQGEAGISEFTTNSILANGGIGGTTAFGGAGSGGWNSTGGNAGAANTGAGGGGGGLSSVTGASSAASGSGGGSGGYVKAFIFNPTSTYSYVVGAGGSGGSAGTSGTAGGAGASGYIIVREYYANGAVGTATNITATSNSTLTSLPNINLSGSQWIPTGTTFTTPSTGINSNTKFKFTLIGAGGAGGGMGTGNTNSKGGGGGGGGILTLFLSGLAAKTLLTR